MNTCLIKKIIEKFSHSNNVCVAVSGGCDSMGLLHFLKNNTNKKITPIIINHAIRKESKDEAYFVKNLIKQKMNLDAVIIHNKFTDFSTSIQENARNIRYELIHQYCIKNNINEIYIGQHFDDQIETYLIRKNSKSGDLGLAGISMVNYYKTLKIIRPFLQTYKQEIKNYCVKKNIDWVDDPSNENINFQRVKIRKNLQNINDDEKQLICEKIFDYGLKRQQIYQDFKKKFLSNINFYYNSIVKINNFTFVNYENKFFAISQILNIFSNKYYQPRTKKINILIKNILNAITEKQCKNFVCHNCQIIVTLNHIFIAQEQSKICQNKINIFPEYVENGNYFAKNTQNIKFINKQIYTTIKTQNNEFLQNLPFPKKLLLIIPFSFKSNATITNDIQTVLEYSKKTIKNYNILFTEYIEFYNRL